MNWNLAKPCWQNKRIFNQGSHRRSMWLCLHWNVMIKGLRPQRPHCHKTEDYIYTWELKRPTVQRNRSVFCMLGFNDLSTAWFSLELHVLVFLFSNPNVYIHLSHAFFIFVGFGIILVLYLYEVNYTFPLN